MKTVLGIIGSPRRSGNCELVAKQIGRHLAEDYTLHLLRLSDFNIMGCRACYRCLTKPYRCQLEDDFHTILEAIVSADALIACAPAYFLGANASLKRFLDRGLAFYAHAEQLWQKPAVGVAVAGIPGKEGGSLLDVHRFLKLMLTDVRATEMLYGALPGEVFLNDETRKTTARIAEALITAPEPATGIRCPLCGADTFRFLDAARIRCMVCSNSGTLDTSVKPPVADIARGDHELFLTFQDVLAHRDWLLGMKDRFIAEKKRLKAVTQEYRHEGLWVRPSRGPRDE